MKSNREYVEDNLLSEVDKILNSIDDSDNFSVDIDDFYADHDAKEIQLRNKMDELVLESVLKTNGHIELNISEDEMEVYATLYPGYEGGEAVSILMVESAIFEKKIFSGHRLNNIEKLIRDCNYNQKRIENILIIKGKVPIEEKSMYIEVDENLLQIQNFSIPENEIADFRKVNPFMYVKKGQQLALIHPVEKGAEGQTVFGRFVPFKVVKIKMLKPGKNIVKYKNGLCAECDGRFIIDDKTFYVSEILEIKGDVDYQTGNIDFSGDIVIHGEIHDGFEIFTGGSLYCKKTLDASVVETKKDIIVNNGIIGKMNGKIDCGGFLQTKFIENCTIKANGEIFVRTSIVNSQLFTQKRVKMSVKGMIIGGKTVARNGVFTGQLGSKMGPATEINGGIDFVIQHKLEWIRDKNITLVQELKKINHILENKDSQMEALELRRDNIRKGINKMNLLAKNIIVALDRNEEATITVTGMVYPGVYIEICHMSYIVNQEMSHVVFRLDKDRGCIIAEKIKQ